jgi:hypothetical protein
MTAGDPNFPAHLSIAPSTRATLSLAHRFGSRAAAEGEVEEDEDGAFFLVLSLLQASFIIRRG